MDEEDYVEEFPPPRRVDPITPCPEFHSMGDVMESCARCGWNREAHDER